jgi:Protein of unknown function (DUF5656)
MLERMTTINRERLSVLVALILLSLSLMPLIESPTSGIGTSFLGTPLRLEFSGTTLVALLAASLACAGVDTLMRAHPLVRRGEVTLVLPNWIMPGLTVVVASQILGNITNAATWVAGLLVTGILLWAVCAAEYATIDPEGPAAGRSRLLLNALGYVLVVLLFGLIWNTRARSLISASLTFLVVFALAFDLLWTSRASTGRVVLLSVAIGIVMAEGNWAINYWNTSVFVAAIAQLLAFYELVGLAGQYLLDRLSRRVLIEFAVVMTVAVLLLLRGRG